VAPTAGKINKLNRGATSGDECDARIDSDASAFRPEANPFPAIRDDINSDVNQIKMIASPAGN